MIKKDFYINQNLFSDEYEKLFKNSWIFVGLVRELSENNDFVTIELFGYSVVVQNMNGEICAFQNVCVHRFNRIQTEQKGNSPFICKYHGWNYNKEGMPRVPKKDTFNREELSCKRLKKYEIAICGEFVFVNMDNVYDVSLKEYLGTYYQELENISAHLGKEIAIETIAHNANWKLLIENVLEGYHCPFVHSESLVKDGFCNKIAENMHFENGHSKWHSMKNENDFNKKKNLKLGFLEHRSFKHNSFCHIHIFPSLVFSSTEGNFFYIGNLLASKVDITNLVARFYSPKYEIELTKKETFLEKAFYDSARESAMAVLLEDKPLVEGCQKGISERSQQTGILSEVEEIRLIEFHKKINKLYRNES